MVGLFRSLNTTDLALRAQTVAIQTVSHNIANANTEGFHRQRVEFSTTLPQDLGQIQLGSGVRVARVQRIVDLALEASVRTAVSNQASLDEQAKILQEMEAIFNEFGAGDLSSSLQSFQNALDELVTNPESIAIRQDFLGEAQALAERISFIANNLNATRNDLNRSVETIVDDLNEKIEQIANLNRDIVVAENGGLNRDSANDLRDQRDKLIEDVAEYLDIRVRENSVGAATVTVGGQLLVFGGRFFQLTTETRADREVQVTDIFVDGADLDTDGGQLEGLLLARDQILVEFVDRLDSFAKDLAFEFNKVHTEGRGLENYKLLTSDFGVAVPNFATVPLATNGSVTTGGSASQFVDTSLIPLATADDFFKGLDVEVTSGANEGQRRRIVGFDFASGTVIFDRKFDNAFTAGDTYQITSLPFLIQNGGFDLVAINPANDVETTFRIDVDLDRLGGAGTDTTLDDLIAQINAGFGAFVGAAGAASRSTDGKLTIDVRNTNFEFAFANDSSNFLAAIGLNNFFTGRNALEIGVRPDVRANPNLVAAARSENSGDNANALALADVFEQTLAEDGTLTLDQSLNGIISSLGVQSQSARQLLENQSVLTANLLTQREAVSGVNLDEEAAQLVKFQRAFQASARMVRVIDELLETLINSI